MKKEHPHHESESEQAHPAHHRVGRCVTLLTKILGIVREALQAGVFGTQTAFDLYTISYNYTIYIFTTVAYALCIAAVPMISRHPCRGPEQGPSP